MRFNTLCRAHPALAEVLNVLWYKTGPKPLKFEALDYEVTVPGDRLAAADRFIHGLGAIDRLKLAMNEGAVPLTANDVAAFSSANEVIGEFITGPNSMTANTSRARMVVERLIRDLDPSDPSD